LTGFESISLNELAPGTYYVKAYNYQKVSNAVGYELSFVPNKASNSQLASAIPAKDANASVFRSVFEDSSFVPFEDKDDFGFGQEFYSKWS